MTLKIGQFAHHHKECKICHTKKFRHFAHGVCLNCYQKSSVRKNLTPFMYLPKNLKNLSRKLNYLRGNFSDNKRRKFTFKEDTIISGKITDRDIAKLLHRSVQSIQTRRCRLNKLSHIKS